MAYFAGPGTPFCILNHPFLLDTLTYTYIHAEIGLDVTIFTGRIVNSHIKPGDPVYSFPYFADFEIDISVFTAFLDDWLSS